VTHKTFIISQLKDDAILWLIIMKKQECHIDFCNSAVVMAGHELVCVDKFGKHLVRTAQVVQFTTSPWCLWVALQDNLQRNFQVSSYGRST